MGVPRFYWANVVLARDYGRGGMGKAAITIKYTMISMGMRGASSSR